LGREKIYTATLLGAKSSVCEALKGVSLFVKCEANAALPDIVFFGKQCWRVLIFTSCQIFTNSQSLSDESVRAVTRIKEGFSITSSVMSG
jgi:hypothetical protein